MQKDHFVIYCRRQLNSDNPNLSENGVLSTLKIAANLQGEKRVLTFKLKVLNILEAFSCSNDIEIINDKDVNNSIRDEFNFFTIEVKIDGIWEAYQVQKIFKF